MAAVMACIFNSSAAVQGGQRAAGWVDGGRRGSDVCVCFYVGISIVFSMSVPPVEALSMR